MKFILFFFCGLSLCACSSSQIIRDSEYKYSQAAFEFSDPEKALEEFPKKEQKGFVTSIEKSWLGFWADKKNQEDLLRQAKTLDSRQYISLSRETEYFFMNESEEGYIPAEHELIVMHLVSAMHFLRDQDGDKARVETKKASYFLENFFGKDQKHFDDPALRIWLASLWAALGEWDEARVDLRRAYELTNDKELLSLIDRDSAPSELRLVFEGSGPAIEWVVGDPLPRFSQKGLRPAEKISYPTLPWFQRHQERNTLIREQISKSNYMGQYYGLQLSKGREKTLGFISSNILRTAGLVVGSAIVLGGAYLIGRAGGGEDALGVVVAVGAGVGKYIWKEGDQAETHFDESTKKIEAEGQEDLKTYRFVRFLPSWISLTEQSLPITTEKVILLKTAGSKTQVRFVQKY